MKRIGLCPWCGGDLVKDGGLWHCDNANDTGGSTGCGAWDEESIWDWVELTPDGKRATLAS